MSSSYSKKRFEIRHQNVISKGVPGVALWSGRLSHCDQVPKFALEMLNLVFEIIFNLPTFASLLVLVLKNAKISEFKRAYSMVMV